MVSDAEAHDVEAHVVDARPDLGVRLLGTTSMRPRSIMVWPVDAVAVAPPTVCPLFTFAPPRRPRPRPRCPPYAPRRTPTSITFQEGTPTCAVRSLVAAGSCSPRWRCRCCSIGNAATATTPSQTKLASATLNGDGSTFQLGFNQVVIGDFKQQQKAVTINYQGDGSGTGRTDFVERGRRLRRHRRCRTRRPTRSRRSRSSTSRRWSRRSRCRTTSRASKLQALGRHDRQDLLGHDHDVGRRRDQGRQPEGQAAEHRDHRRAPQRRLGHHRQLHQLPHQGGARRRGRSAAARP